MARIDGPTYHLDVETDEAPEHVKAAIVTLMVRVSNITSDVRVDVGHALFQECRRRGLVRMEEFTPHGPGYRAQRLPAYGRNIVFPDPELSDWEIRIEGEDA